MSAPATGVDTGPQASSLEDRLQSFVGLVSGPPTRAPDAVNLPMIRHWVEAMGDHNPVYVDDAAAQREGFPGIIAPPTMLQAWIMRGLRASLEADRSRAEGHAGGESSIDDLMALLDTAGYTSVVATNCDQHYARPLVLGDRIEVTSVIDAVSAEKATGLGVGRFVTTRLEFADQDGGPVATMLFRILKFRPRPPAPAPTTAPAPATAAAATAPGASSSGSSGEPPRPKRPRPALTLDNRFFFEGTREHKLLIQRCTNCGTLRHPPRPACANCRSFDWDTVTASGRGTIYSYVVNHYPQVPAFDYPLVVALVELEEGTRLVTNVAGMTPDQVSIGMPVVAGFEDFDDELTLPVFRPAPDTPVHGTPGAPAPSDPGKR
ncbi:MAG: bifunctional MaoC family dehydratase N-terminal/OB-fold nucleic acid binding domain-containing protein [Acidimicrobiales bacterium]